MVRTLHLLKLALARSFFVLKLLDERQVHGFKFLDLATLPFECALSFLLVELVCGEHNLNRVIERALKHLFSLLEQSALLGEHLELRVAALSRSLIAVNDCACLFAQDLYFFVQKTPLGIEVEGKV